MAVQFDPRSTSVPESLAQSSFNVRPVPSGVASAPDRIVSSVSQSSCGWISKICEWIKSWFSSTNPLIEQRIAKGKEFIDETFRDVPRHNPDRTVMVCAMRYGDQIDVVFSRMARDEDHFKATCYQRLEDLIKRNVQVTRGALMVKSYYWEKLMDRTYSTTDVRRELEFDEGQVGRVTRRERSFSPQLHPAYHPADSLLYDLGFR